MDKTIWREHRDCTWTWPNQYGVTGCENHGVVFETPDSREAWQTDGGSTVWARS